jgi:spermidine synthase
MNKYHFIKDEMLVHIPICTHKKPKKIIVIGGCNNIRAELKKYDFITETLFIDSNNAISELKRFNGSRDYDVAIVADIKFSKDRDFWREFIKLLDSKVVISSMISNIITDEVEAKKEISLLGEIYPIVMPYRYEEDKGGVLANSYLLLSSGFYHPTADINLQRADLTDGYNYYSSDVAISSFVVPKFIYNSYLGIIKR